MSSHDILDFLLPNFGDPLQVAFMAILSVMISVTVFCAHKYAGPKSWEEKWNRGTPNDDSDDLDIEHGSVTDLWHAVATGPEKLAEVMPGLLLVVGLLGTFLGLGLALNHASNILGQPNAMSASGAADSMKDLLGLLQGLGTKFKTSTWGISGFVLLKIWSEFTRFEEKRLTWVISKVKTEIDKRQKISFEHEQNKQDLLFNQMSSMTEKLAETMTEQVNTILKQNAAHHEKSQDKWGTSLVEFAKISTSSSNGVIEAIRQQSNTLTECLVATTSDQVGAILKQNAAHHEESLEKLGLSLVEFTKVSRSSSNDVIEAIRQQSKIFHADIQQLHDVTLATSQAMTQFTESTREIVGNMSDAAHRMAAGADRVGGAAGELVIAIDAFKSQFTDVLDNVRKDLGSAIQNMSQQASTTLEKGSQQLGDATREISMALGQLSDDVKATMNEVKGSINEALKIQKNASIEFTLSSQALNDSISATTGMVDKLGKPIEAGLVAISTSNRETMGSIKKMDQAFAKLDVIIEQLSKVPQSLQPLESLDNTSKLLQGLISELRSMCDTLAPIQHLRSDSKELVAQMRADSKEISNHIVTLTNIPAKANTMIQEIQGLRQDIVGALNFYEKEPISN